MDLGESINHFLDEKNYNFIKNLKGPSVQLRENGQKVVCKNNNSLGPDQAKRENEILDKPIHDRLPKKIEYFDKIGKEYFVYGGLIVKEYIEGKEYNHEQLFAPEEQKLIDLIKTLHKEGYSNLDIHNENFILTPKKELYFIDLGLAMVKREIRWDIGPFFKNFQEAVREDWNDLEKMLKKSIELKIN